MKKLLVFLIVFSFCTSENTEPLEEEVVEAIKSETEETIEVTTTSIQVTQLETFDKEVYKVNSELSSVSYLAPKQFLNANLEIVEGVTNQISGEFKLTLSDCDSADSCLQVEDLAITADLSTLKSGSSIRDGAIQKNWLESKIFPEATYKVELLFESPKNGKIKKVMIGTYLE